MTIHWAHTDSESAADAMAAVERALVGGETRAPDAVDPRLLEVVRGDPYLAESLVAAHQTWAVDQHAIVISRRPMVGWAINRFQRLVRKATWWYGAPQWDRVNAYHGAALRAITALVKGQHALGERLEDVAGGHILARTALLEQQIHALREEQRALREHIADLERRLGV